jgi:hypothetical protein
VRSSVKAAYNRQTDDLVDRTRAVWQPRLGRDLSPDEAKQIAANVTGFFAVLAEWACNEEQEVLRGAAAGNGEARDDG